MLQKLLDIQSTAPTVDQAVAQALVEMGCTRAETRVTILETPKKGFLGMGRRTATVRVELVDRGYAARRVVLELLRRMGLEGDVHVHPASSFIELEIITHHPQLVIGRHGTTLDALQSLATALVDRGSDDRTPFLLDVDNYRQRRSAALSRLARKISARVRKTGQPAAATVHSSWEQRVLGDALRKEPGVIFRPAGGRGPVRELLVRRHSR
jgi:spoIIIJ-associated protein